MTVEGWACWRAAEACMRAGMVQPHVDLAAALQMTSAAGVAPSVAAELLAAVQDGMGLGLSKRSGKG